MDVSLFWMIAVIIYSIVFVVQFVVNFLNFLRTGKITKMQYNPPTKEEVEKIVSDSNGDYIKALESLISFHETELQKLKSFKKE